MEVRRTTVVAALFIALSALAAFIGPPQSTNTNTTETTSRMTPIAAATAQTTFTPVQTLPAPAAPTASTETVQTYLTSQARINEFKAAVHTFGLEVRTQAKTYDSPWGVFDAYCFKPHSSDQGGYRSQGYMPVQHDYCWLQHNPDPGYGAPYIEIATEVIYGPYWYSHSFLGAAIQTPACTTDVELDTHNGAPSVTVGNRPNFPMSDFSKTVAAAKAIDAKSLWCLAHTRP